MADEDPDAVAVASIIDQNAAIARQNDFRADRHLSLGMLGYEGQWRNAMMFATKILETLKERGWTAPERKS